MMSTEAFKLTFGMMLQNIIKDVILFDPSSEQHLNLVLDVMSRYQEVTTTDDWSINLNDEVIVSSIPEEILARLRDIVVRIIFETIYFTDHINHAIVVNEAWMPAFHSWQQSLSSKGENK